MNRQLGGKATSEGSEQSPLSLLVHAADAQHQRPQMKGGQAEGRKVEEEQAAQRQAVARAEALQQQQQQHGLFSQLRGAGLSEAEILQQNAAIMAAQQQHQAAALALASDIRSAVAAAQLRQAAQLQNQDLILARAAAMQQQLGSLGGVDLQQELELQRLEELERRQLLAAAAGAPLGALAARQQLELQEAQLRQEQLDRQLQQAAAGESILERAGMRAPVPEPSVPSCRAVNSEQGTKDTFQKTPGSVVVPCRARGMPMDHNFKTAYFVIPENVEHGEELICSYFACRNAGIKFRYCTHCKVPVAKRNFRKRHKHGKTNTTNDAEDDQSNSGEEDSTVASKSKPKEEELPPPEPKVKKEDAYCQETSKPRVEEVVSRPTIQQPQETVSHPPVMNEPKTRKEPSKVVSDDSDASQANHRPKISVEREKLWAGLLAKRPPTKDGEAVSAWLMEVLSVSDLDTPLKENGTASSSVIGSLPPLHGARGGHGARGAHDPAAQAVAASKEWSGNSHSKRNGAQSVLIKKKRHHPFISKEDDRTDGDVGSFAEWKDRKKHKGPKKGYSVPSE